MRRSSRSRTLVHLLGGVALALLGGCSFFADEFVWLDRAAPAPPPAASTDDRP